MVNARKALSNYKASKEKERNAAIAAGCVECGIERVDIYRHTGAYCNSCHVKAIENNDINPYGVEVLG